MTQEQQNSIKVLIAKSVAGKVWADMPDLENRDFSTVIATLVSSITVTEADVAEMGRNPNGDHRIGRIINDLAEQAKKNIIKSFIEQGAKPVRR